MFPEVAVLAPPFSESSVKTQYAIDGLFKRIIIGGAKRIP